MTATTTLTTSQQLANALVNYRAILLSPVLQPLTNPDLPPATQAILASCYNAAARACDEKAPPTTFDAFMAAALADCDSALAFLATHPDHASWQPAEPAMAAPTLAHIVTSLALMGTETSFTGEMAPLISVLPTNMPVSWSKNVLCFLTCALRMVSDDYDASQVSEARIKELVSIVLPLLTSGYFGLSTTAAFEINIATDTPGGKALFVGVQRSGQGIAVYSPAGTLANTPHTELADCHPILRMDGHGWTRTTYVEMLTLAA